MRIAECGFEPLVQRRSRTFLHLTRRRRAFEDYLEALFAGVTVWNSEENDSFDSKVMEKDLREEMDRLMESFAKIPKLNPEEATSAAATD